MKDFLIEERFQEKKMTWSLFRRLFGYTWRYKGAFILNMALAVVATASMLFGPHLIKIGIDTHVKSRNIDGIYVICGIFLLNMFFGWGLTVLQAVKVTKLGQTVLNDLRRDVFRHIQDLSMSYFDRTKQGRIIARADSDIETMEFVVSWGVGQFVINILTLTGVVFFMLHYNWKLCLAVLAVIPPFLVTTLVFKRLGLKVYRVIREGISRITAAYAENISGVKIVQSFIREEKNFEEFREINDIHNRNVVKASLVWGGYMAIVGLLGAIGTATILLYGGSMVLDGTLTIGEVSAYILYIMMLFGPIEMLAEIYNMTLATAAAAERIFALLDTEPQVKDRTGAIDLPAIRGEVTLEHVFFSYNGNEPWIVADINLHIKAGETVALVGQTGAGKTTIVNLIASFYRPQRGTIRIDGHDLSGVTVHSLRSQMGIVPQDSFLFTGTVMENIRYGKLSATDDEVVAAAKTLGADEIIAKMGKGYQTEVRERGGGLSHGERQLICFTRALLADPRILILDEATSAVDTHTEYMLHGAVQTLVKGRTTFIIAHRLSTARIADRIVVVENGAITEAGTHAELAKRGGSYSRMVESFYRQHPRASLATAEG